MTDNLTPAADQRSEPRCSSSDQPAAPELAPGVAPFDYSALPSEHAELARNAAEAIRTSQKRIGRYIRAIGQRLTDVKAVLDHGQFGAWLAAEFSMMTARTAQNYMSAWVAFGDKSETVSHLPPHAIYALAAPSTPVALRHQGSID